MSAHTKIASLLAEHPAIEDARTLAAMIYDDLSREDLVGLVVDAVKLAQRGQVRRVERETRLTEWLGPRNTVAPAPSRSETLSDPLAHWRPLLTETVRLGDGTCTTFATATLEQWRQRRSMYEKKRAGLDRHIEICLAAEATIIEHGVTCLADLETSRLVA